MSEYNQYVDAINKIFENIANLKLAIIDSDNVQSVENIESYQQIVIDNAKLFSNKIPANNVEENK